MLHQLLNPQFSRKKRKRVGRGPGSTLGKTSGKGHKGQRARSGYNSKPGFEGGQTPLHRRLPKKGFTKFRPRIVNIVNIGQLFESKKLDLSAEINYEALNKAGLIKHNKAPVKLLSEGEMKNPINISVDFASKGAVEKVQAGGGQLKIAEKQGD